MVYLSLKLKLFMTVRIQFSHWWIQTSWNLRSSYPLMQQIVQSSFVTIAARDNCSDTLPAFIILVLFRKLNVLCMLSIPLLLWRKDAFVVRPLMHFGGGWLFPVNLWNIVVLFVYCLEPAELPGSLQQNFPHVKRKDRKGHHSVSC